ncbi:MAG: hypothetical protein QME35_02945 [Thermoanaerobacteraceae bacterium]|nr:hypothetical protein [Thermoanaerobacteraceae bacterium]
MLNKISNFIWDFVIALISVGLFIFSHIMFVLVDYNVIVSGLSFIKGTGLLFIAYVVISLIGFLTIEPVTETFSYLVYKTTMREIETVDRTDFLIFSGMYFIIPFAIFLLVKIF